jgi:hypothetical protein
MYLILQHREGEDDEDLGEVNTKQKGGEKLNDKLEMKK